MCAYILLSITVLLDLSHCASHCVSHCVSLVVSFGGAQPDEREAGEFIIIAVTLEGLLVGLDGMTGKLLWNRTLSVTPHHSYLRCAPPSLVVPHLHSLCLTCTRCASHALAVPHMHSLCLTCTRCASHALAVPHMHSMCLTCTRFTLRSLFSCLYLSQLPPRCAISTLSCRYAQPG